MQLEGKVALVTGGGTGIGAAVAQRFVAEGAKVVITGRRREMLEEVAKSVPSGSIAIFSGDVTEEGNAQKMVAAALALGGKLDVLVNNAAIEINAGVVDMDPADWRKMLEINLTGPFLMMKAAIPTMIEGGGGSIINVASVVSTLKAVPNRFAYATTKGAVIALTKAIAADFVRQGDEHGISLDMGKDIFYLYTVLMEADKDAEAETERWIKGAEAVVEPSRNDVFKACKLALAFENMLAAEDAPARPQRHRQGPCRLQHLRRARRRERVEGSGLRARHGRVGRLGQLHATGRRRGPGQRPSHLGGQGRERRVDAALVADYVRQAVTQYEYFKVHEKELGPSRKQTSEVS